MVIQEVLAVPISRTSEAAKADLEPLHKNIDESVYDELQYIMFELSNM